MEKKYFKLFSNCVTTKGKKRSIIADLQKNDFIYIPNLLFEVLSLCEKNYAIDKIKKTFDNKIDEGIDTYFNFLFEKEIGFYTNTPKDFPSIIPKWDVPNEITNFILDYSSKHIDNYAAIISEINDLACDSVQIRIFESFNLNDLRNLVIRFKNTRVYSIQIILSCAKENRKEIKELFINLQHELGRISSVTFFSCKDIRSEKHEEEDSIVFIYSPKIISSCLSCGNTDKKYFSPNLSFYNESLKYNTCLNRKISIDINGNIKNCPSMQETYGNIKETTLQEALNLKNFKKYWEINKDKVKTCQDCEFRNICTDCRAYIENPKDIYSKPLKCGYNPSTNEWEDWSTNSLKQKAIEYYGM